MPNGTNVLNMPLLSFKMEPELPIMYVLFSYQYSTKYTLNPHISKLSTLF